MAALECGVDLMLRADIAALRAKSIALTDLFIHLVEERCGDYGFALASPRDASERGSQVSLRSPDGYAIMQALIARGVIGDFRTPDFMRFGFAPIYLRYIDVWDAVEALRVMMASEVWQRAEFKLRAAVT